MLFVPAIRESEQVWSIKCLECGQPVAQMSSDELTGFLMYLIDTREPVFCFECDTVRLDEVPPALLKQPVSLLVY